MPVTLTTPQDIQITTQRIKWMLVDVEANVQTIAVADLDAEDNEVHIRYLTAPMFDDFDTVIEPSGWSATDPTAAELYELMKRFFYMRFQELPGESGIGAGTIT